MHVCSQHITLRNNQYDYRRSVNSSLKCKRNKVATKTFDESKFSHIVMRENVVEWSFNDIIWKPVVWCVCLCHFSHTLRYQLMLGASLCVNVSFFSSYWSSKCNLIASDKLEPLGYETSSLTHWTISSLVCQHSEHIYHSYHSWHATSECNSSRCCTWTSNLRTQSQLTWALSSLLVLCLCDRLKDSTSVPNTLRLLIGPW